MVKKVVCITGCLGFIASHLTQECLDRDWLVIGYDKQTYAARDDVLDGFLSCKNFKFCKQDINDIAMLPDCDYVINVAAESHVSNSIVSSHEFIDTNIRGVQHLLDLTRYHRYDKKPLFFHFSTDEVYGDTKTGRFLETDPLKPSNPYAATKAAADMLVHAWGRTYDIPYIIYRPTNNYGTGQHEEKLIPKTCRYLSLGRKIPLHDNGSPVRTWLHALDTASGVLRILDSGIENEIFNVSGNFEQSNYKTVEQIMLHYNIYNETDYMDLNYGRPGQDVRYAVNDDKLQNIGWYPRRSFEEGLKWAVHYYKEKFGV